MDFPIALLSQEWVHSGFKTSYRPGVEKRAVWMNKESGKAAVQTFPGLLGCCQGLNSQYRRDMNAIDSSPSQPFQERPLSLLSATHCLVSQKAVSLSLSSHLPCRDYIRINGSKVFWFWNAEKTYVHWSWVFAWHGGTKRPAYWISSFMQPCEFIYKYSFATQLTNLDEKMWSIQQVWEGGNCTINSSLLFENMILKCRLILFNERTFQQL